MSTAPRPMSREPARRKVNGSAVEGGPATGTNVRVGPESAAGPATLGPTVAKIAALSPRALGTLEKDTPCSRR